MAERNFDIPAERRMLLRIGVNLGDIIHDGTRTYGDGINVAARLEPLAEPGGICISAPVREAIFGKLGLPLRDIGEKSLKNIARPVHIYQIQPPGARARRDWLEAGLRQYRRLAPALGLVVLLAAIAGAAAWRFWPRETMTPDYTPVIAVLPFASAEATPSLSASAQASHAKCPRLSTFPLIRVRLAVGLGAQAAARRGGAAARSELCARRRLLQRAADKLRIRAQLTDAASGETALVEQLRFRRRGPDSQSRRRRPRKFTARSAESSGKMSQGRRRPRVAQAGSRPHRLRLLPSLDDLFHARTRSKANLAITTRLPRRPRALSRTRRSQFAQSSPGLIAGSR